MAKARCRLVSNCSAVYGFVRKPCTLRVFTSSSLSWEARPLTATTSKIVYTLMLDESTQADDAAREADKTRRANQFMPFLENMKILAEGGTLPPTPARGGAPKGGAPKQ